MIPDKLSKLYAGHVAAKDGKEAESGTLRPSELQSDIAPSSAVTLSIRQLRGKQAS